MSDFTEYIGLKVSKELMADLRQLASDNQNSLSAEVRRAIVTHLKRAKAEAGDYVRLS